MTDTPTSNTSTLWQERNSQDHVIVAQAESEFGQVQQSFNTPKAVSKVAFRDPGSVDVEKGHDGDPQEAFDLREYLTSSNDANSAAGIKHKHVGVTWEDLEVSGIGGEENKVRQSTRCPRFLCLTAVFVRSTCLHTQVSNFDFFLEGFFLISWIDAVAELITFPFVVLRNVLQPILPKRLSQAPPVRTIIHKYVSEVENTFSAF